MQALARPCHRVHSTKQQSRTFLSPHAGRQRRLTSCSAQPQSKADAGSAPSTTPDTAAPAETLASTSGRATGTSSLLSKEQQAAAFGFLSGTSLAFGAAALAVPELLLSVAVGGDASTLDIAFTRIAGATMAISAAAEYSIRVSLD